MNYNQFTKQEIIQKIINVEPKYEKEKNDLFSFKKERLLKILDKLLEAKAREVLND